MPLVLVKEDDKVIVLKITGNPAIKKRLEELGFIEGALINIISNNDGDVILEIKGTKLAITKEMSQKIIVKALEK